MLSGGEVQGVDCLPAHSSSIDADTEVDSGDAALRTATKELPSGALEITLRVARSSGRTGGMVHGPAFPSGPTDLFNVSVSYASDSRQNVRVALASETATDTVPARREVAAFIVRYNRTRRQSSCEMKSPVDYEELLAQRSTGHGATVHAA